jgi:hypothetical protein
MTMGALRFRRLRVQPARLSNPPANTDNDQLGLPAADAFRERVDGRYRD